MEESSNKGAILADDMGLGKTLQAIALILSRPSTDRLRKVCFLVSKHSENKLTSLDNSYCWSCRTCSPVGARDSKKD